MEHASAGKPQIRINIEGRATLLKVGSWARVFGIIGYILCSLIVMGGVLLAVIYKSLWSLPACLLLVGACFYPVRQLYLYGRKMNTALRTGDEQLFNGSMRYLKHIFQYIAIAAIVAIAMAIVAFVILISFFILSLSQVPRA